MRGAQLWDLGASSRAAGAREFAAIPRGCKFQRNMSCIESEVVQSSGLWCAQLTLMASVLQGGEAVPGMWLLRNTGVKAVYFRALK